MSFHLRKISKDSVTSHGTEFEFSNEPRLARATEEMVAVTESPTNITVGFNPTN